MLAGLEVEAGDYAADLYAGAGTFTLPLARAEPRWWPWSRRAAPCAICARNAERAGADIDIIGGDAARELPELGVGRARGGSVAPDSPTAVASIAAARRGAWLR